LLNEPFAFSLFPNFSFLDLLFGVFVMMIILVWIYMVCGQQSGMEIINIKEQKKFWHSWDDKT
jgi:hypothetical protein